MVGFKKTLPMSSAMRPGGFGTVPPPKSGSAGAGGGNIPKGLSPPKAATAPKAPSPKINAKLPGMPKMPKLR